MGLPGPRRATGTQWESYALLPGHQRQCDSASRRMPFVFGPKARMEIMTTSMQTVMPAKTPGTPKSRSNAAMRKPESMAPARLAEYTIPLARHRIAVGDPQANCADGVGSRRDFETLPPAAQRMVEHLVERARAQS